MQKLGGRGGSVYNSALISRTGNSYRTGPAQHWCLYPGAWKSLPTYERHTLGRALSGNDGTLSHQCFSNGRRKRCIILVFSPLCARPELLLKDNTSVFALLQSIFLFVLTIFKCTLYLLCPKSPKSCIWIFHILFNKRQHCVFLIPLWQNDCRFDSHRDGLHNSSKLQEGTNRCSCYMEMNRNGWKTD